ncbi:uncharacterized protein LOC110445208 isoform X4 [Mizuhopecten yessoensis]|uniref:uncharacterized protein LOC110445208 isoform X4 n=1 Tax=Mizuhopecten yessoensis TaxID=6573 RepID=UPI000B458875|nr:uncharacterized protein LOC110445208 isoform X4 [Mizuhopecten yessoensis]
MSILKLSEDSPDSKRSEHVKTASVSFGEVYIQESNGTGSDVEMDLEVTPLTSPRRAKGKKHARVIIPPTDGESMGREEIHTEASVTEGDRTSPKTKAEKVSFCDNEISSQPNEISGRQRQPSPTTYSEVIILDSLPPGHWPIKRSASLESRDNPFMPGSDLCKEAEEILQKATIIRDRFILRDETDGTPEEEVTSETKLELHSPGNGKDCSVVEETLLPQTSASVNAAPNAKARQNGKIDDTVSPTTVKVEVGGGQSDGLMVIGDNKDKKKQKKCCSVM